MKIATIVPTKYLYLVQNDSYHLCLAQMIGEDEKYTDFYASQIKQGRFVILDNGQAEGFSPEIVELYEKAKLIGATEIQLPDRFFEAEDTVRASYKAMEYLWGRWNGEIMAVPQGRDLKEWTECARALLELPITSLGIPKNLVHTLGPYGRIKAILKLQQLSDPVNVGLHLLGCWEDPREIGYIHRLTEVGGLTSIRGVDSGIASIYAAEGRLLDPKKYPKPSKKVRFEYTDMNESLLEHNIKRWRAYCYDALC